MSNVINTLITGPLITRTWEPYAHYMAALARGNARIPRSNKNYRKAAAIITYYPQQNKHQTFF